MQTNLFNGPVMQTVDFTLIPWILDRVEDDKRGDGVIIPLPMVIARKPSGMAEAIWRRGGESKLRCHSRPVSGTG